MSSLPARILRFLDIHFDLGVQLPLYLLIFLLSARELDLMPPIENVFLNLDTVNT